NRQFCGELSAVLRRFQQQVSQLHESAHLCLAKDSVPRGLACGRDVPLLLPLSDSPRRNTHECRRASDREWHAHTIDSSRKLQKYLDNSEVLNETLLHSIGIPPINPRTKEIFR